MKQLFLFLLILGFGSTFAIPPSKVTTNDQTTPQAVMNKFQTLTYDSFVWNQPESKDALITEVLANDPLPMTALFSNDQMLSCLMSRQEVNFSNSVTINTGVCNELICKEAISSTVLMVGGLSFQTEADIANIAFNFSNDAIVVDSNQKNSSEVERSPFV